MAKFDYWIAMENDGVQACPRMGGMEDERFYYRVVGNDVHVGIKAHFDRWANSVDFVFSVPKTQGAYEKLKARLDDAMRRGSYDKGSGEGVRL